MDSLRPFATWHSLRLEDEYVLACKLVPQPVRREELAVGDGGEIVNLKGELERIGR